MKNNKRNIIVAVVLLVLLVLGIGFFISSRLSYSVSESTEGDLNSILPNEPIYIIGNHLFTEKTEYLSNEMIMLAATTINFPTNLSNKAALDYMVIYARDLEGNWINANTGDPIDYTTIATSIKWMDLERYLEPVSLYNAIATVATSDESIDFGTTPTTGIYTLTESKDYEYPVHYYRGAVTNNNIVFGGFCWKIVRTTETGGTKLVYNGKAINNKCDSTGNAYISKSAFNSKYNSPADVSYVYGTARYEISGAWPTGTNSSTSYVYANDVTWDEENQKYILSENQASGAWSTSSNRTKFANGYHYTCFTTDGTCGDTVYYITYFGITTYAYHLTFTNGTTFETAMSEMFSIPEELKDSSYTTTDYDSTIKTIIDNWYETNLKDYGKYLENTVWCNERTFATGSLAGKYVDGENEYSYFSTFNRLSNSPYQPTTTCSNDNDKLYVGNGLKYPVALLTADEYVMAGYSSINYSSSSYLYISNYYPWTMSPAYVHNGYRDYAYGFVAGDTLENYFLLVRNYDAVRPSVSLASGTYVEAEGDGTAENPYVVIME